MVISHALWQRRYGGDSAAVGRATNYNGESYTIVGVLPDTFDYFGRANANNDIFLPIGHLRTQSYMRTRDNHPVMVVGRLKADATLDRARLELSSIGAALEREHPGTNRGVGATVTPLLEDYVGDMRLALSVLLGASWLLLAIACVNVANLLLARASTPSGDRGPSRARRPSRPGRAVTGAGRRLRETLVIGQVALCVTLLIATGLLVHSFQRLIATEPGYDAANVVTMRPRLPDARYRTREQVLPVLDAVTRRIATIPGVERVSLTTGVPLGRRSDQAFVPPGQPAERWDRAPLALTQWVGPDYHRTLGIATLAGRTFTAADRADSAPVAIVDDELVRRYLPGRGLSSAIGERVRLLGDGEGPREIVGVVRHIRHSRLDEDARPEIYIPFEQAQAGWQLEIGRAMDIAVRGAIPADAMVNAIRATIRELDPELPLSHVTTLESALERSMGPRLFNVVLLSVFGSAALLLCVVGIYGVVSYSVSQRTREIGVRMTLGAQPAEVVRMVMRRGLGMVVLGIAGGAGAALLLGRVVEGLLFGIRARDPITFITVVTLLTAVAVAASYLPARRAAGLDLTAALRQD